MCAVGRLFQDLRRHADHFGDPSGATFRQDTTGAANCPSASGSLRLHAKPFNSHLTVQCRESGQLVRIRPPVC